MDKGMEYPADIGHFGRRMTFLAKDPLPALWPSKFLLSCGKPPLDKLIWSRKISSNYLGYKA
jgi:hypothetical protein